MFDLERLEFSQVKDAHPDRFNKVDLLAANIEDGDGPRFIVKRADADRGHVVELVEAMGQAWGHCDCEGFGYNSGPCSHLCAVWRAELTGLLKIPAAKPTAISVEMHDRQQEIADHAAEPEERPTAADGGLHR